LTYALMEVYFQNLNSISDLGLEENDALLAAASLLSFEERKILTEFIENLINKAKLNEPEADKLFCNKYFTIVTNQREQYVRKIICALSSQKKISLRHQKK
jgi:hypothetical protein